MTTFQQNHFALNSDITLTIRIKDADSAPVFFKEAIRAIDAFEKRFSRFQPDSELSTLNKEAGARFTASKELIEILQTAKKMSIATDGAYNPFVLPALQKAGYVGSWPKPDESFFELNYSKRKINDISDLKIGSDWIEIPEDSALDLGGIGKGYLLDQLADFANENDISDFWFSLGGDIIFSGDDDGRIGWEIGVADAKDESINVATFETSGEKVAVTTSGTIKRNGENWHHIIDPRTGLPAKTDILTATVIAESAILADVWAKSLVILGSKKAIEFAQLHQIDQIYLQTNHKVLSFPRISPPLPEGEDPEDDKK